MDWAEIATQIILGIVGIVMAGLGTLVTYLINKYVKDNKLKTILSSLNEVVQSAVSEVYQTYVQALKEGNMFDEACQKEALSKALEIIKNNLPNEVMTWIQENYSGIDAYLKSQIEGMIGMLKNSGSSKN